MDSACCRQYGVGNIGLVVFKRYARNYCETSINCWGSFAIQSRVSYQSITYRLFNRVFRFSVNRVIFITHGRAPYTGKLAGRPAPVIRHVWMKLEAHLVSSLSHITPMVGSRIVTPAYHRQRTHKVFLQTWYIVLLCLLAACLSIACIGCLSANKLPIYSTSVGNLSSGDMGGYRAHQVEHGHRGPYCHRL